ncbi:DMT family transporter [Comamonas sp. GB3 AK4-5]|uniref:DMT family transporter n=1 Tax=Comamonas sp. GB3 AK4-5 TaxID=3231487 RepID=UPI00351E74B5
MSSLPGGTALASPGESIPVSRSALLGIALTLSACALFALLDSATKFAGQLLPMLLVLWLRFLAQALVTTALVLPRHGLAALRTGHAQFQAGRALFGITTSVCAFFCIQSMPLGNFTAIWSACPLLVVVASAWLYQERVSPLRWLLLGLGLVCVIVIVRPERSDQALGWQALLPVGLLLSGSGYLLLGSRLARLDAPHTTQLYSTWLPLLLTTPLLPWFWQSVQGWQLWLAVVAMGLCSGVGHLILLQAYTHATPSVISPFLYSQIGFAMAVGWLLFGQVPDAQSLLGMAGVVLCGVLSMWLSVRGR